MRAASLFLILALAGCLQGTDDGPETSPKIDPVPATATIMMGDDLAPVTIVDGTVMLAGVSVPAPSTAWLSVDGRDAREPTVAVDSDGTLYYTARDYEASYSPISATQTPIMRSDDGGLNWTEVSPRLPTGDREPPRSGDPMVVADPWTDRIFQLELYDLVCNWLVFTDTKGDDWTGNAKGCGSLVVDHQTIGAGPAKITPMPLGDTAYPNIVYICVNQIADSHCARSLTGGLEFSTFTLVYPGVSPACAGNTVNPAVAGGIHGHVLVGPDGTVYLPREYCGRPYVAISHDDGITWTLQDLGQDVGAWAGDPNMAFDGAGNVYYAWTGDDQRIWMVHTSNQGDTWSDPVAVSQSDLAYANHVSLTAGSDGRVGMVYLGAPMAADGGIWDNVTWNAYMAYSLDATAAMPTVLTMQANPEGDAVYRGDCRHIRCGYIREFLDASVAPDGSFWGAFVDACLTVEERKYDAGPGDCNTEAGDYGQGNGHLGYVGHFSGPNLYADGRVVSGGG